MLIEAQHHGGETLSLRPEVTIVDFEAQTADLIRWAVVENGIRAELVSFETCPDVNYLNGQKAVILSGGRASVNDINAPRLPTGIETATLGICYSGQAIAKAYGGQVERVDVDGHDRGEFSVVSIDVVDESVIFGGAKQAKVRMSHHDSITKVPDGFRVTAISDSIIAAFENDDGTIVGTQFHPEVRDTEDGRNMILRFLKNAGIEPDPAYTIEVALDEYMEREEAQIAEILERGDHISGFLSGGVDSMVAAKAIIKVATDLDRLDQVKFFHVDNGHMRIEDEAVIDDMIAEGLPVEKIDAAEEFFHRRVKIQLKNGPEFLAPPLVEADDPEVKRAIHGKIFYHISKRIIAATEDMVGPDHKVYFMQGTNASDIVESREVKGHHNVSAMEELRQSGQLIEPLRHLLKYHIRYLAECRYGLPATFAKKQPFPGPGLSPRIIVNSTGELEKPDGVLQERLDEMVKAKVGNTIVAHLVKMKSVGVKGDSRSVADAVFLTGDRDWQNLNLLSDMIPDYFDSVNRIFYVPDVVIDRDSIHGAKTHDDERFAEELRQMEEIHRQAMIRYRLDSLVSQHYVATLPVDLVSAKLPTLSLRLFITGEKLETMTQRRSGENREDFRTGIAAIPGVHINRFGFNGFNRYLAALQKNLKYHGALAYDLTSKPPGSTELE